MRIMVMFDLPTEYANQRKAYRKFRKHLIKDGFIMLQESIYCKIALNHATSLLITNNIKKYCPEEGIVQILIVTEKQFSKMEILVGDINKEYVNNDERFIEL